MDLESYYRFVLALLAVLALIWGIAWAIKRFGFERRLTGKGGGRGKRLTIVEVQPLDARRKLVLLRRDSVEHLLLLGAQQELVVEAGIDATGSAPAQESSATTDRPSSPIAIGLASLGQRKVS